MRGLHPFERGTIFVAIGAFADFDAYDDRCEQLAHLRWTPGPEPVTVVLSDVGEGYKITVNEGVTGEAVPRTDYLQGGCSG